MKIANIIVGKLNYISKGRDKVDVNDSFVIYDTKEAVEKYKELQELGIYKEFHIVRGFVTNDKTIDERLFIPLNPNHFLGSIYRMYLYESRSENSMYVTQLLKPTIEDVVRAYSKIFMIYPDSKNCKKRILCVYVVSDSYSSAYRIAKDYEAELRKLNDYQVTELDEFA